MKVNLPPYTLTHVETKAHTQTHQIVNHARKFEKKDLTILTLAILTIRELLLIMEYFGRASF